MEKVHENSFKKKNIFLFIFLHNNINYYYLLFTFINQRIHDMSQDSAEPIEEGPSEGCIIDGVYVEDISMDQQ